MKKAALCISGGWLNILLYILKLLIFDRTHLINENYLFSYIINIKNFTINIFLYTDILNMEKNKEITYSRCDNFKQNWMGIDCRTMLLLSLVVNKL